MTQNIKLSLPPNENSRYHQNYFENAKKYVGDLPIVYRSSWERSFMLKMELNPRVDRWSSEQLQIPYTMKERVKGKIVDVRHTYHTDFTVWLKNGDKYIIEIKPQAFCPKDAAQIRRDPVICKNYCKWRAAMAWCKMNGYMFKVVTENELKTRIF